MSAFAIDQTNAARSPRLGTAAAPRAGARIWTGRVLSTLVVLFLLFDGTGKLLRLAPVMKGTVVELGYPATTVVGIGVVLLACTGLYLVPRTAILGAVLLTGYLGGAVASQVRVGNPLFGYVLFPVYVATAAWIGLYLRDPRLRAVLARR